MTLLEAITLAVSHHPKPYRQIKHYWKWKIILAGTRGDILVTEDEYDRDSFMKWLHKRQGRLTPIHLDADVKLVLNGKDEDEVSKIVNEAVRQAKVAK